MPLIDESTNRADWRYVCQNCDYVTMDANEADVHEDDEVHTVIRNRAFKEPTR
ncbi:MAG TPA: hypothetical protein VN861_02835 [Candidatus Acidoferrales bacterium]|nr:hypothetical protein [Candidatus Acidoferrales bacterium]